MLCPHAPTLFTCFTCNNIWNSSSLTSVSLVVAICTFFLLFYKNMLLYGNITTFSCQSDVKLGALAGLCSSGGFVLSEEEAYTRCVSLWWLHGVCQFTVKHNPGRTVVLVTALIHWSTFYIWKHYIYHFSETASSSSSSLRCCFGLMLAPMSVTWPRRTSCSFHSCFLLESTGCSIVRVKQRRRGCGCSVDMKGLLWPRPALLQNADSLFRPTHESHHRWVFWTRQGGGIGGSIYTRCFNWLLLDWFSLWRTFRMTLVHLCQSLNAWKPSLWSSGAGSKTLFP